MKSEILAQLDLMIEGRRTEASYLERLYAPKGLVARENNIATGLRIARAIVAKS